MESEKKVRYGDTNTGFLRSPEIHHCRMHTSECSDCTCSPVVLRKTTLDFDGNRFFRTDRNRLRIDCLPLFGSLTEMLLYKGRCTC